MHDAWLLALETSSRHGSVALGRGSDVTAYRPLSADRRHTTELLPAVRELLAEAGCRPGDVGVVCFSQGPGSFTGLRVAATVARMWQSAVGSRVVGVPTLEAIARNALRRAEVAGRIVVLRDARRGQVFGAVYERALRVEDPLPSPTLEWRGVETRPSPSPSLEGRGVEAGLALDGRGVAEGALRVVADAGLHDAATWLATLARPGVVLGDGVPACRDLLAGLDVLPEELWEPDARQVLAIGRRLAAAERFCRPEQIVPAYLRPPECEEVYEQRRAEARARREVT